MIRAANTRTIPRGFRLLDRLVAGFALPRWCLRLGDYRRGEGRWFQSGPRNQPLPNIHAFKMAAERAAVLLSAPRPNRAGDSGSSTSTTTSPAKARARSSRCCSPASASPASRSVWRTAWPARGDRDRQRPRVHQQGHVLVVAEDRVVLCFIQPGKPMRK